MNIVASVLRNSFRAATLTIVLLLPALALGQASTEVKLTVQLDKFSWYWEDGDPNNYGTAARDLTPLPAGTAKSMMRNVIYADVVSINGKPARGAYVSHGVGLATANSDLSRNHAHYFVLDIKTPELAQIGDLFGTLLASGASAPGAPLGAGLWCVYGGSGAYIGVRGQGSNVGGTNFHTTTMKEDLTARRAFSNGQLKLDFYLTVENAPEIQAAYHSADGSAVTNANPASPGETLMLQVRANWPTSPPREPGRMFPENPLNQVANLVEASVNDIAAETINMVGWPGTRDRFRVDVRLPAGTARGDANLQLTSGYIPGVPYVLPVR
ncbi:MAG: hypothetical protein IT165_23085 [Bryobacterales bacterium]|nr:hypothetical protein [Bryobacterales bacterium]